LGELEKVDEGGSFDVGEGGAATVGGGAGDDEVRGDSDDVVGGTAEVETEVPGTPSLLDISAKRLSEQVSGSPRL
jgi:hypothetical protein